ncbi:RES family NAD+ phosphorylase [Mycolicibacterium llatzerense]|uniref:RES family NAD+ phosphorylase n=1 Tax=Mycolicibacterium llatzerense TaxID=280871 RepID=UPI002E802C89|nr:RES family NAD+ phosphorylase [Mycolicibacterium llatzerense]
MLYVGEDLATSACEVFGEAGVAAICPNYRVSILAPTRTVSLFDLTAPGAAMTIGALPSLAAGNETRTLTQQWARAIYEDKPAGRAIYGVRYLSAYNSGYALALWDCADRVETVSDSGGAVQDLPLADPRILNRLQVQLRQRRIAVTTVAESDCAVCRRN